MGTHNYGACLFTMVNKNVVAYWRDVKMLHKLSLRNCLSHQPFLQLALRLHNRSIHLTA